MAQKEISFADYLYILVKWRTFIIKVCLGICIVTACYSLIMAKTYRASATILPPVEEEQQLGLSSLLNKVPMLGMLSGTAGGENYLFMAILNSRSMMESIIKQFDLMTRYKTDNIDNTIRILKQNISFDLNEDGTITISALAKTKFLPSKSDVDSVKNFAAGMANFIVNELDRINKRIRTEKAVNYRMFIEKRYLQNENDLERAENDYNEFQKTYGAIDLPIQTEAAIKAAAEIKAQIIAKEVEVDAYEKLLAKEHSTYKRAKIELDALRNKYKEFKDGYTVDDYINNTISKDVFIPLGIVPEVGLQYARLFREVKLQETLMEFLLPQYEQAKIQEAKDTPTVQVLDKAVPPDLRAKPKRAIMVIMVGFISFLFCTIFVFSLENYHRIRNDENNTWNKIFNEIETDLSKFLQKFRKNR